ncbi:ABC transporter substrate-binding protein [Roseateles sp. BYS87W]|uniref:ABC transporter substrate-binding protein n=1 Tax=Pelomonas baiyunensis TaxID=3299026 RepID=A0ABW7H028_9BURK
MLNRFTRRMALALAATLAFTGSAHAEEQKIRISHGHGLLYLPLMVMRDQGLIEKQAQAMGLGPVQVNWIVLDGGNVINDAMLAGNLDIAGIGAPGFITLWSKARGIPRSEVIGLSALSSSALWLNTTNPAVKSLKDIGPKDKIAIPGIKTSLSAVILQMVAAKTFGVDQYDKLDANTVSLAHPEAMNALLTGKTEINAHLTSPPFAYIEAQNPKVHRVFDSTEVLGNITLDVVFAAKRFVDDRPKHVNAFLAAQEEANALIAKDRKAAAQIYLKVSNAKVSMDEVEKMLADPAMKFSTTPVSVMDYAVFMSKAGTIKTKPAKWTDLFVPNLHSKQGS